jgi:EXS family
MLQSLRHWYICLICIRLFFILINSIYSFYWDVAQDWDLSLFSSTRDDPEYPFGLRRHRFLHAKEIYYFAIALDLLLRFTWTIKLSHRLDRFNDMEGGIFIMEVLEVFRRWIWIFLRVETEWGRLVSLPSAIPRPKD